MSLVCYGSSDSEEESEEQKVTSESEVQSVLQSDDKNVPKFEPEERSVLNFNSIPKPVSNKGRETVKITIPSLDQFKDEDIKVESKAKPIFKGGSGLLSMLPPPKYSGSTTQRCLTPHVLTKQKTAPKKVPDIKSVAKKSSTETFKPAAVSKVENSSKNISANNDDEEEDDSTSFDFFSLESVNKKIEVDDKSVLDAQLPSKSLLFSTLPEPSDRASHTSLPIYQEEAASTSVPFPSYSAIQTEDYSDNYGYNESYSSTQNIDQTDWSESYQGVQTNNTTNAETQFLEDEGFKKLLGRKKEDIKFIDVKADDQLIGKEQWLMQSLTEEKVHRPSKRKGEMPTQQQKRKHQITYLAFQAKERELDLKNQWSLNSRTRRETQAKYGF